MKRNIAFIFILLGLLIMLFPTIEDILLERQIEMTMEQLTRFTSKDLEENLKREASFDYTEIKDVSPIKAIIKHKDFDNNYMIGQLIIPSINLNQPILKGISDSNLSIGAATMKDAQVMGEGNFSLAGHYFKGKDILFGRLMEVEVGDLIEISDKKYVYEYEVYDIVVAEDTQVKLISDEVAKTRGKSLISLMTCYYSSKTGKRFFVIGELVSKYSYVNDLEILNVD